MVNLNDRVEVVAHVDERAQKPIGYQGYVVALAPDDAYSVVVGDNVIPLDDDELYAFTEDEIKVVE